MNYGTGGIKSKLQAARIAAHFGAPTIICSGFVEDSLLKAVRGEDIGTFVCAKKEEDRDIDFLREATRWKWLKREHIIRREDNCMSIVRMELGGDRAGSFCSRAKDDCEFDECE